MERNEIFTFTAPNGVEVTAVVVYRRDSIRYFVTKNAHQEQYVVYAQNRLSVCNQLTFVDGEKLTPGPIEEERILVDYCVIPEYDDMLRNASVNSHENS